MGKVVCIWSVIRCNTDFLVYRPVVTTLQTSRTEEFKTNYINFESVSRNIVEKHAPLVTRAIRKNNSPPWMDSEFKKCRAERRKMEKKSKRTSLEEDRKAYLTQRQICAEMSINKQKEYYSKIVNNAGNDQKSLFKVVNEVLDKNKTRALPEHEDPIQLANEFNDYYIDKIVKLRKTIPKDEKELNITVDSFKGEKLCAFEPMRRKSQVY